MTIVLKLLYRDKQNKMPAIVIFFSLRTVGLETKIIDRTFCTSSTVPTVLYNSRHNNIMMMYVLLFHEENINQDQGTITTVT